MKKDGWDAMMRCICSDCEVLDDGKTSTEKGRLVASLPAPPSERLCCFHSVSQDTVVWLCSIYRPKSCANHLPSQV